MNSTREKKIEDFRTLLRDACKLDKEIRDCVIETILFLADINVPTTRKKLDSQLRTKGIDPKKDVVSRTFDDLVRHKIVLENREMGLYGLIRAELIFERLEEIGFEFRNEDKSHVIEGLRDISFQDPENPKDYRLKAKPPTISPRWVKHCDIIRIDQLFDYREIYISHAKRTIKFVMTFGSALANPPLFNIISGKLVRDRKVQVHIITDEKPPIKDSESEAEWNYCQETFRKLRKQFGNFRISTASLDNIYWNLLIADDNEAIAYQRDKLSLDIYGPGGLYYSDNKEVVKQISGEYEYITSKIIPPQSRRLVKEFMDTVKEELVEVLFIPISSIIGALIIASLQKFGLVAQIIAAFLILGMFLVVVFILSLVKIFLRKR